VTRWPPLLVVLVAVVSAGWWLLDDNGSVEPIDITAMTTRFERPDELVGAADLVVEGIVIAVADGRVITDSLDPTVGFETSLATLAIERSLAADAPEVVVVEQEMRLLDGPPITVNGVAPFALGDHVIVALVVGGTEEFPYSSPVNEQAVFHVVDDDEVIAADPDGPIGVSFHRGPVDALRDALGITTITGAR